MKKFLLVLGVSVVALVGLSANKCSYSPTFSEQKKVDDQKPVTPPPADSR